MPTGRSRVNASRRARFLIVQTGSTFAPLQQRRGDFPEWFRRGLRLGHDAIDIVRVDGGESLPEIGTHDGVVITGSPAMVSERAAWSETAAAWLRCAIDARVPLLGVCYGHQLLAHALGGRVDFHPGGREIGTVEIERLDASADDALLGAAPSRFLAHATHRQSVIDLPVGAVVLARSSHDPHHAVRYAECAWGLQFHPEFSVDIMRDYLRRRAHTARGDCGGACCASSTATSTPHARRLLRRFRAIAEHPKSG